MGGGGVAAAPTPDAAAAAAAAPRGAGSDVPVSVHSGPRLSLPEKALSAGGASVVSALLTNPLDVIKTRLQMQARGRSLCPPSVP